MPKRTVVAVNVKRVIEGFMEDSNKRPPTSHSIMGATIYVDRTKVPESCDQCIRRATAMKMVYAGHDECAHVECPHRKRVTAQRVLRPGIADD